MCHDSLTNVGGVATK